MAVTRINYGSSFTNLVKSDSFLDGNSPYNPSSFESIATVTVGAGGSSSISFTSIPSTYTHLQVRMIFRDTRAAVGDYASLQFNSDTGSNYALHLLSGSGASAASAGYASQTSIDISRVAGSSASSNVFGAAVLDILNYANTNKYKTTRSLGGVDNNGSGEIVLNSGLWMSTSAVSTITIKAQAGSANFSQYSSFALYGVK